jgi:hypothetical protein
MQSASKTISWLEESAEGAFLVHVNSSFPEYDDFDGVLAPPNLYPMKANPEMTQVTFTILVS